jgi:hypothetical protein
MTALQIAYAHCANWRKDGKGCLGAMIDDDLQIRRCYPRAKCVLSEPGKRCPYFEECVAPMAPSIDNPKVRSEFEAAVRDYRGAAELPCADERPCPICGRPMETRRRFCGVCAGDRRKASTRAAFRKHWLASKQLRADGPLKNKGSEGVRKAGQYGDSGQAKSGVLTA